MTRYELRYELTDEMADAATRRFMLHHLDRRVLAIALLYVLLLWLLCALDSDRWMCGVFAGAGLLLALLVAIAFLVRGREVRAVLRRLPHRAVRWELADGGISRHSALGTATWPWSFFDALLVTPDFYMFLVKRQLQAFVPTAALPPEQARFVRDRVRAAGGKVMGAAD